MYTDFYGLREMPFGLTPNPKYFFRTESHIEMMSNLRYGIEHHKGLVVITGEVGSGKTTTLRATLQDLGPDILTVYIFNPFLSVQEFFTLFTDGLGLELSHPLSKAELLPVLVHFLASRHNNGLRTVLIIDEAHGVPAPVLEEVRLLMNFETNSHKILQVILCGQPELRDTLNRSEFRQLKQRISLRCSIKEMSLFEVEKYVRFRLKKAGAERVDVFDTAALRFIWQVSGGIPRVVNNICDNALLCGFGGGREVIDCDLIDDVLALMDLTPRDQNGNLNLDFETTLASNTREWIPMESHSNQKGSGNLPRRSLTSPAARFPTEDSS